LNGREGFGSSLGWFRVCGVNGPPVCPAFPLCCPVRPVAGGVQADRGVGRWTALCRAVQAGSQGQVCGMCRLTRRAERAILAGTLIRCARIVEVVARAWKVPARTPTARVRLCVIAHRTVQAALAVKTPDGR
jgi:hypothetical protein